MRNLILKLIEFAAFELIKEVLVSNGIINDDYTFDIIFMIIRSIV